MSFFVLFAIINAPAQVSWSFSAGSRAVLSTPFSALAPWKWLQSVVGAVVCGGERWWNRGSKY